MFAELTPAVDTPTFAVQARGASADPGIPGSAGWWREKRAGQPETTPGGDQWVDAPLDLVGSSWFAYPGVPDAPANAANPGQYVLTGHKPGGESQAAKWLFNLAFSTESPVVEIRLRAQRVTPYVGLVFVNGRRVQERAVPSGFATAGGGYSVTLTFPDARPRTIMVCGLNSTEGSWGGVAVAGGYVITKPAAPARRVAIIGDSYVNGHDTVNAVETFAWRLALLMGADSIIQAGIGGTGWGAMLGGNPASTFTGRIPTVLALQPTTVIFAGGRNDAWAGLQGAVEQSLDLVGGNVDRLVLSTASETQADVRTAIAAACAGRGVPYLPVSIDSLPKIPDGVHPTYAGHVALADEAFALLPSTDTMPSWLTAADVALWAQTSESEAQGLGRAVAAAIAHVEHARSDLPWGAGYVPPANIVLGSTMLAWRWFQRYNTSLGYPELGGGGLLMWDPDIATLLQVGHKGAFVFAAGGGRSS